jgi:hypothetical protein
MMALYLRRFSNHATIPGFFSQPCKTRAHKLKQKRACRGGIALAPFLLANLTGADSNVRDRKHRRPGGLMSANIKSDTIETTLGELIAAVTDAAVELTEENQWGAYVVASLVLEEILRKAPLKSEIGALSPYESESENLPVC